MKRMRRPRSSVDPLVLLLGLALAGASCRSQEPPPAPAPPASAPVAGDTQPAQAAGPRVVFLGDSLTAGLGLSEEQAYPALLAGRLAQRGQPIQALNAGVSGDTTAGGLRRLDWLLRQQPSIIVVGLGANDALRGLPLSEIESNLRQIVTKSQQAGAQVLLLGMQIPPNYGPDYARGFADLYPRISKETKVALVPFLLAGVGGEAALNQADGIHPTAAGQEKVADNVLPYLLPLLPRPAAA